MNIIEQIQNIIDEAKEISSIKDHLISRGIDPNRIGLVIDEKTKRAYFFLYNLSGKLVGYQQYNPLGSKDIGHRFGSDESKKDLMKYYTYITGKTKERTKEIAVWGLDTYNKDKPYLFIVEGIFDASSLHNAKVPAIAVLANDPDDKLLGWLKTLPQKRIVICDNDDAGRKLGKAGNIAYTVPSPYKDLNEMPQKEVNIFIKQILKKEKII